MTPVYMTLPMRLWHMERLYRHPYATDAEVLKNLTILFGLTTATPRQYFWADTTGEYLFIPYTFPGHVMVHMVTGAYGTMNGFRIYKR